MGDFQFELEPVDDDRGYGLHGNVGELGEVVVFRDVRPVNGETLKQVVLSGPRFPDVVFNGGAGGSPSLDGGWLQVDGAMVNVNLKITGMRKGSRWLEMKHRDRIYTYGVFGKVVKLRRGDSSVKIERGRFVPGVGRMRVGHVRGELDATDLGMALVLEVVDTSALSTAGALFAAPLNLLFGRRPDGGSEW